MSTDTRKTECPFCKRLYVAAEYIYDEKKGNKVIFHDTCEHCGCDTEKAYSILREDGKLKSDLDNAHYEKFTRFKERLTNKVLVRAYNQYGNFNYCAIKPNSPIRTGSFFITKEDELYQISRVVESHEWEAFCEKPYTIKDLEVKDYFSRYTVRSMIKYHLVELINNDDLRKAKAILDMIIDY